MCTDQCDKYKTECKNWSGPEVLRLAVIFKDELVRRLQEEHQARANSTIVRLVL